MDKTKTRVKKFYHNHKKVIDAFGAGFAIASAIGMHHASHVKKDVRDGMLLAGADLVVETDTGQKYLYVELKNGETGRYPWLDAPAQ